MAAVPIRVVIIEDAREVREGLRMLIDGTGGFNAANFRTMEDALAGIGGPGPTSSSPILGCPAIYYVVDAVLIRKLPVTRPDELIALGLAENVDAAGGGTPGAAS
jgi:hypothetical protein